MRICPNYRPGFLRGLGLSYYLLGQLDTSIDYFRESIARESEYLSAYTTLAAIHGEQGNAAEAAKTPPPRSCAWTPIFPSKAISHAFLFEIPTCCSACRRGYKRPACISVCPALLRSAPASLTRRYPYLMPDTACRLKRRKRAARPNASRRGPSASPRRGYSRRGGSG